MTDNIENLKQDELNKIFSKSGHPCEGRDLKKQLDAVLFRALKPTPKMLQNLKPILSEKGKILFYGAQEETASKLKAQLAPDFHLEAVKQEKITNFCRTIYSIVSIPSSPT